MSCSLKDRYYCSLKVEAKDDINTCDYQTKFCSGLDVHGLNTRNRKQLYLPNSNLSAFQKGTMFTAIKLFNRLPITIQSLKRG